jgi:hypothetical protein
MSNGIKNIVRAALIFAALPLMAACASGPTFDQMHASEPPAAPDAARLYFYREASMVGSAVQPSIKLNGIVVGDSKPGGYFFVDRPAGSYEISTTTEVKEAVNVTLAAGQVRYVRTNVEMGLFVGHVLPSLIESEQGALEIKGCHYTGGPQK